MQLMLIKAANGFLYPMADEDADKLNKKKVGTVFSIDLKEVRNYKFLKKFMSLMKFGFDHWDVDNELQHKGELVAKQFDQFRKDVTILAGYYEAVYDIDGNVKLIAKSISFANMEEDEFERLYSDVINVILGKILKSYTRKDIDDVVNHALGYA